MSAEPAAADGGAALAAGRDEQPQPPRPSTKTRSKRKRRKDVVTFCATDCKYECIRNAVAEQGWRWVESKGAGTDEDGAANGKAVTNEQLTLCNIHWVDVAIVGERLRAMQPWQRCNHFPGMTNVARKARLAQNLEKMRKEFPKEYGFYPRTWVLPADMLDFRSNFDQNGRSKQIFIIKPDAGCQGRGIFLTQEVDKINPGESVVAQQYIRRPLLIDDFKFDLRLYILVTSCKPLRMFMFHDGLVRLCTEEYVKPTAQNLGEKCMHLTNYAINKHSDNFQANSDANACDTGSKRSLRWFMEWVADEYGEEKAAALWRRMGSLSVKVVISILPTICREYDAVFNKFQPGTNGCKKAADPTDGSHCFELLGIDVMIDSNLRPWLIEINHLPSFATDSPLDLEIKSAVIEQTLRIIRARPTDRREHEAQVKRESASRLYKSSKPSTAAPDKDPSTGPGAAEKTGSGSRSGSASGSGSGGSGSDAAATPPAVVAAVRRRITAVYSQFAPDRVGKIDALLDKYRGKEEKLATAVELKYGVHSRNRALSPPPLTAPGDGGGGGSARQVESDGRATTAQDALSPSRPPLAPTSRPRESLLRGVHTFHPPPARPRGAFGAADDAGGDPLGDGAALPEPDYSGTRGGALSNGQGGGNGSSNGSLASAGSAAGSGPAENDGGVPFPQQAAAIHLHHAHDPDALQMMEEEDALLEDFDRIFPVPPGNAKDPAYYDPLIEFSFEHEHKRVQRLQCPLQQRRGSVEFTDTSTLPPLPGNEAPFDGNGRNIFGDPFRRALKSQVPEAKPLPKPGPKQAAAAERLARGYSSLRHEATVTVEEGAESDLAVRLSSAAQYAKEWRQRVHEAKSRKHVSGVAIKPKTFSFVEDCGGELSFGIGF